jgi:hypothetical protein
MGNYRIIYSCVTGAPSSIYDEHNQKEWLICEIKDMKKDKTYKHKFRENGSIIDPTLEANNKAWQTHIENKKEE